MAPSSPLGAGSRRVSRREALAGVGAVSLTALLAACGGDEAPTASQVTTADVTTATVSPTAPVDGRAASLLDDAPACALTPAQSEGPFHFDADAVRGDIREDREGAELRLALRVRDAATCEPLRDAVVEIWHCDASGVYSGFDEGEGERFLRGAQVSDADGVVAFTTIVPGWYPGRTPHIHAKVHLERSSLLTTQLYFDEATLESVYARAPYAARGRQDVPNARDGIFREDTVLRLAQDGDVVLGAISFDVARA